MTFQHSQELISFCLQVNELKTRIYGLRQQQQQKYLSKTPTPNLSNCWFYFTLSTMLMCNVRLLISGSSTRFIFPDPNQMMSSFNCVWFSQSAFTLTCWMESAQLRKGKTNWILIRGFLFWSLLVGFCFIVTNKMLKRVSPMDLFWLIASAHSLAF